MADPTRAKRQVDMARARAARTSAKVARADATQFTTAAVLAWLWRKGCRAIGTEVGYDTRGLGTAWKRHWRADVVGMQIAGICRLFHLVEVKGTRADLVRESWADARGKWQLPFGALHLNPWLAIGPGVDKAEACMAVGLRWGVLAVDEQGYVEQLRKPFQHVVLTKSDHLAILGTEAIALSLTANRLPALMGRAQAKAAADLVAMLVDEADPDAAVSCTKPTDLVQGTDG